MMKTNVRGVILFLAVLLLGVQATVAGDLEFEAGGGILSHYMWRGICFNEGGVFQPTATVGYKGFSANLWGNYAFDGGRLTEVDFTASYSKEVKKVTYEGGFIHYGVYKGLDSDELYGGLTFSNFLSPSIKAYIDVNAGKGAFLQAAIAPSVNLTKKVSLNFGANMGLVIQNSYMGLNDAGNEFTNLYNAEVTTSVTLPLSKHWRLEPMVGYTFGLSSDAKQAIRNYGVNGSSDTFYGGATLTFSLGD